MNGDEFGSVQMKSCSDIAEEYGNEALKTHQNQWGLSATKLRGY